MKSAFDILVKVNFNHSYFFDGVFNGFALNISDSTSKICNNHELIVKPFRGGFYILFDQFFAGKTRTREQLLAENLSLEFTLILKDTHFYNYNDSFTSQLSQSLYYFRNTSGTTAGLLHAAEFVSEKDIFNTWHFKERFFVKPFAKLDLAITPGLAKEYSIRFQARSTKLRYILVSKHLQELKNLAVIDSQSAETFCEPSAITLPDNSVVNGFTSTQPVMLNQFPGRGKILQLVENYEKGSSKYKVVIRALPFPDINAVSLLPKPNISSTHISDIFI